MIARDNVNKNGRVIIFVIGLFWVIFVLRAVQVQIVEAKKYSDYADSQHKTTMPLAARRGTIYDRNGQILAYDVEAKSYALSPRHISNKPAAAAKLAQITDSTAAFWMQQFAKRPRYLLVDRQVSPQRAFEYDNSGIETLKARAETKRNYTYNSLAFEIIGRTDPDKKGISGLESYYDSLLAGKDGQSIYLCDAYGREVTSQEHTLVSPVNGSDIYLTLDLNLQQIVENELQMKLDSCQAKWGSAIFMDLQTGGILACATLEGNRQKFRRCRAIADENEPGSTAKLIPLATVFQEGIKDPDDEVNVENGKYSYAGHIIRDDHKHDILNCKEIGIYSSNIGAAKLGITAGADLIYKYLVKFGFGARTGIDFPAETPGTLRKPETWSNHELAITCFGYGFTASSLQLACAYGAAARGGELLKPYFASMVVPPDGTERILNSRTVVRKVLEPRTMRILDGIFRDVVQMGTATKAIDDLCLIAGKTGTALRTKENGRGYESGKALATFAGYFPADDPRIVGVIMYDSPHGSIYGGEISAPVFRRIARRYATLPHSDILMRSNPKSRNEFQMARPADEARVIPLAQRRTITRPETKKKTPIIGGFHDFLGLTMRDAATIATNMGIKPVINGSGTVISQNPPAGMDTSGVKTVELVGETK